MLGASPVLVGPASAGPGAPGAKALPPQLAGQLPAGSPGGRRLADKAGGGREWRGGSCVGLVGLRAARGQEAAVVDSSGDRTRMVPGCCGAAHVVTAGRSRLRTGRASPAGRRGLHLWPGIRNSGPPLRAAGARSSPLCQSGAAVKLGGGNLEGAWRWQPGGCTSWPHWGSMSEVAPTSASTARAWRGARGASRRMAACRRLQSLPHSLNGYNLQHS